MRVYNNAAVVVAQGDWGQWASDNIYTLDNEGCVVSENNDCKILTEETVQVAYPSGEDTVPLEVRVKIMWKDRQSGRQRELQAATLLTGR